MSSVVQATDQGYSGPAATAGLHLGHRPVRCETRRGCDGDCVCGPQFSNGECRIPPVCPTGVLCWIVYILWYEFNGE